MLQHGGLLAAGLIGGLLAASPLSRTQKTGAVLTELTGLGVAALKAGLLDPNQVGGIHYGMLSPSMLPIQFVSVDGQH